MDLPEGAIFHSDRGSNYTSAKFAQANLQKLGIRQSVGRTGICYDNALSESVNGTLKVKLVHTDRLSDTEESPAMILRTQ